MVGFLPENWSQLVRLSTYVLALAAILPTLFKILGNRKCKRLAMRSLLVYLVAVVTLPFLAHCLCELDTRYIAKDNYYLIETQARVVGSEEWKHEVHANVGDRVEFQISYRNSMSGVKISDTDFSGNHAAICTSSKPESNLSKNSPISSAGLLQPTLECGRILL